MRARTGRGLSAASAVPLGIPDSLNLDRVAGLGGSGSGQALPHRLTTPKQLAEATRPSRLSAAGRLALRGRATSGINRPFLRLD